LPPKPAYLGIAGQTVQACRYPAGVRITRVIEGSPAQQAGLKGEGSLTWPQAMAGVLTLTPFAPFVLPFFTDSEHGGSGDLILAVDGKRIHTREELEQEMKRFRPGDTVYFSVLREQSGVRQIPVHLAEYPDTPTTATAR
jgi:S1-C subfamily serine protease